MWLYIVLKCPWCFSNKILSSCESCKKFDKDSVSLWANKISYGVNLVSDCIELLLAMSANLILSPRDNLFLYCSLSNLQCSLNVDWNLSAIPCDDGLYSVVKFTFIIYKLINYVNKANFILALVVIYVGTP